MSKSITKNYSMMKNLLTMLLSFAFCFSWAQDNLTYQKPPKEILDLVDYERAPSVIIDDNKEYMIFLYRDNYKSIDDLSKTELRLAGLRIDPSTNIGSRVTYSNNVKVRKFDETENEPVQVEGLPLNPKLSNFSMSPDQSKIAMTNTTELGVELWVLDIASATAKKLTDPKLNANMGDVVNWFEDSEHLLVKMVPGDRKPLIDTRTAVPTGPTISENNGQRAQNRTYQDLLKNKNDEFNFEQLARSELYKVSINGEAGLWKSSGMYDDISF